MFIRLLLATAMVGMSFGVLNEYATAETTDAISVAETDWAWWRGPNRNGVAQAGQQVPKQWDDETNVLWKSPVSGRGHGAPTVVGDWVFLATADEEKQVQSVLAYHRDTGKQIWKSDIHSGGFEPEGRPGHPRASKASSTIASDGHRVFVSFFNSNAVYTTALTLEGEQLWQQKVTDYAMHQGYGASPTVYGPLTIVSADNKGGGAIKAFDRESGDVVWAHKRPESPNYASPIILEVEGRDQLLFTGCELITSLDPLTGKLNWEVPGATAECVSSVVSDGEIVVTSGGYPRQHIAVVRADGSGEEVWANDTRVYVPSMILSDGHIYGVTDAGAAFCHNVETGALVWEERLRAKFAASPILVDGLIYATGDKGTTFIFKATPAGFELVGENTITADEVEATAAICGDRIYLRVAQKVDGRRQEMLYCIGNE